MPKDSNYGGVTGGGAGATGRAMGTARGLGSRARDITPGLKGDTVRINSAKPGDYSKPVRSGTASAPRNIPAGRTPKTVQVNSANHQPRIGGHAN